jgi:hypothetical protein
LPAATLVLAALAAAILAGGWTAYYEIRGPVTYRSQAVLLFDQTAAIATAHDSGIVAKLTLLRVKYSGIVGTQTFAKPVADTTGFPVGAVHGALNTSVVPNSFLLGVSATMPKAEAAHTIAVAAADELVKYADEEQRAAGVKAADRVDLSIVTPATNASRQAPSGKKAALYGIVVFIGALLVVLAVAEAMRYRYRGPVSARD